MPTENTSEETYIINESPEISIGENAGWFGKIKSTFPALENKNYKLYFYGQLVSLIGTWLQIVAQSWLVLQLTNSAFLIGLVMALSTLPTLFFTLFGGVIVDRFSKKKILLFTQSIAMVLAFILGLLTMLGWINVWEICVISFLLGVVNAIDAPAR
ncbi:MAG TPA: MFS transporter, partial [Cytophagaceae bacterium]|nr:MFS transporter [Cytophagaceae bacterium]